MDNKNKAVHGKELLQALDMFVELTGQSPDAKKFTVNLDGSLSGYDIHLMYREIQESLELDKTNVTAFMLLDAISKRYFSDCSFSVLQLIQDPVKTQSYLDRAVEFQNLIHSPEIKRSCNEFMSSLVDALKHYKCDTPAVMTLIETSPSVIAELRRDALRSFKNLKVHQFLKGVSDTNDAPPRYLETVYQFWNVDSLLGALRNQPSGISLNLVRSPDEFSSYFAFAVRNGGNLFTISDMESQKHPLQAGMRRRPDRQYDSRASKNWFPYELLDIEVTDDSERMYVDRDQKTRLIPYQQELDPMTTISQLKPESAIWTVMMFDLIKEKFWKESFQLEELSFTGNMIHDSVALVKKVGKVGLPVTSHTQLSVKPLVVADVKKSNLDLADVGSFGGHHNDWFEDRYSHLVSDEDLNIMSRPDVSHYLPPLKTDRSFGEYKSDKAVVSKSGVISVRDKDDDFLDSEKRSRTLIHSLSPYAVGTREQLDSDRKFIARYNMAKQIQSAAHEEFVARSSEIETWWVSSLLSNIEKLEEIASVEDYWVDVDLDKWASNRPSGMSDNDGSKQRLSYRIAVNETTYRHELTCVSIGTRNGCFITGAKASYSVVIQPKNADDLAMLIGQPVSELPDVLQHWMASARYQGNSILDRIDPMAWAIKNPWEDQRLGVILYLSKSGLKKLQKKFR